MIKTVGNAGWWSLLCLYGATYAQQEPISLHVTDMHGRPITHIEAGTPCTIKATAQGISLAHKDLIIQGLDDVIIESHEAHMQIINGASTIAHVYRIRIDKPGLYQLGPACADYRGKRIVSAKLTLEVTSPGNTSDAPTTKKEAVFARLALDKTTVFVGEKVGCSVRFYTRNSDTRVTNIVVPSHSIMQPHVYTGPREGTEIIRGSTYHYSEWHWVCCPKTPGEIIIPAYSIIYTVPLDPLGGFSAFFGTRLKQYVVYTNAVTMTVKNLPSHNGPVHAIGSYKNFTASCEPSTATVGEGIILTLTLEGSQEGDSVINPELTRMPSALNYYNSQVTVVDADTKRVKTKFEYIIQGTQPGEYEIPVQTFTFFDPVSESYKTLRTASQKISITGPAQKQPEHVIAPDTAPTKQVNEQILMHDTVLSLPLTGVWYPETTGSIPYWLLVILFLLPPFGVLMRCAKQRLLKLYGKNGKNYAYKKAFFHARARLDAAKKLDAYGQLYPIFFDLLALRLHKDKTVLTDDIVCQELSRAGLSAEQIKRWQQFFVTCASFVFATTKANPHSSLFTEASDWIATLESIL